MSRYRILSGAKDAGGALAVMPVLKKLLSEGHKLRIFAEEVAFEIYNENNIACEKVAIDHFEKDCSKIVGELGPNIFFLSNSWGWSIEKILTLEAKIHKIPSIALLDSWAVMDEKFCNDSGDRWYYFPDHLIVMDDYTRAEMIKMGAPEERIFVMGQPYLETYLQRSDTYDEAQSERLRMRLGVNDDDYWVVFLSQAMQEFYGDEGNERYLGYKEHTVLEDLIDIIEQYEKKIVLSIRFHPREDPSKFDHLLKKVPFPLIQIEDEDPFLVMAAADLVVGMDTMLLIEAHICGFNVISYQPNLKKNDQLITNLWNITPHAYSRLEFQTMFETYVAGRKPEYDTDRRLELPTNSVENIYNFIVEKCSRLA